MSGRLTTHVLDLARGGPAAGMALQLWKLDGGAGELLRETVTNSDGRLDAPLLTGEELTPGATSCCLWPGIISAALRWQRLVPEQLRQTRGYFFSNRFRSVSILRIPQSIIMFRCL